jgi:hypothetical protein
MIVTGNTKADWGLGVGLAYPLTAKVLHNRHSCLIQQ